MFTKWIARFTALGIALALPLAALAAEPLHARVSISSGGGMIKGATDNDWSYATTNTLVLPGDTLWVDKEGSLEVELAGGVFLRLADQSKAEIVSLPPGMEVRGWTGSFYLQRTARSGGSVRFAGPACYASADPNSMFRVDVQPNGGTVVSVFWGSATVASSAGGATTLREGQRSYCDPGLLPSEPVPFSRAQEDSFDAWNRDRAKFLAVGETRVQTPVPVANRPVGYDDLGTYGDWVTVDSAVYWRPTVVVDYVPYRYGRWNYVPGCGYVWVGDYPFCYVTSHYGRWTYRSGYGWLWSYGDVWAPAWVATVRYGSNFVWAPLDPWDRPVSLGGACITVGDVTISIAAASYCPVGPVLVSSPYVVQPCVTNIFINIDDDDDDHIGYWRFYDSYKVPAPRAPSRDENVIVRHVGTSVKQYAPERQLRGVEHYKGTTTLASTKVQTLEKESGAPSFIKGGGQGVRVSQGQGVRTASSVKLANEPVRKVSLAPQAAKIVPETIDVNKMKVRPEIAGTSAPASTKQTFSTGRPATNGSVKIGRPETVPSTAPGTAPMTTPAKPKDSRVARIDEPVGGGTREGAVRTTVPREGYQKQTTDVTAPGTATQQTERFSTNNRTTTVPSTAGRYSAPDTPTRTTAPTLTPPRKIESPAPTVNQENTNRTWSNRNKVTVIGGSGRTTNPSTFETPRQEPVSPVQPRTSVKMRAPEPEPAPRAAEQPIVRQPVVEPQPVQQAQPEYARPKVSPPIEAPAPAPEPRPNVIKRVETPSAPADRGNESNSSEERFRGGGGGGKKNR